MTVQAETGSGTRQIQFSPDEFAVNLQSSVDAEVTDRWRIGARKGQTLRLTLADVDRSGIRASLIGPRGSNQTSQDASSGHLVFPLPMTGTCTVIVETDHQVVTNYRLMVEIR